MCYKGTALSVFACILQKYNVQNCLGSVIQKYNVQNCLGIGIQKYNVQNCHGTGIHRMGTFSLLHNWEPEIQIHFTVL